MSIQDRILSLQERHQVIEGRLKEEQNRPSPDGTAIHELKRQKLRIKDQIAALQ